jgi:hypothetical protein
MYQLDCLGLRHRFALRFVRPVALSACRADPASSRFRVAKHSLRKGWIQPGGPTEHKLAEASGPDAGHHSQNRRSGSVPFGRWYEGLKYPRDSPGGLFSGACWQEADEMHNEARGRSRWQWRAAVEFCAFRYFLRAARGAFTNPLSTTLGPHHAEHGRIIRKRTL